MRTLLQYEFWITFAVLGYTFAGYPLLMHLLAKVTGRSAGFARPFAGPCRTEQPALTVVLAVHNEEQCIASRLDNLLCADYPADKLSVLVVDDASTDRTVNLIAERNDPRVSVIRNASQRGKAACLNQAMAEVRTALTVFTDARQSFQPDAIARLVAHFDKPKIGAVSGALVLPPTSDSVGESVGLYWRLERQLRLDESHWDSCIGCTGAIYALRSALYRPIPDDTLLDDVVIPMQIVLQGYRVAYDLEAVAVEPQTVIVRHEARRKRRTLAGNFQMLFRYPGWMLPWRNRTWWQLISHKYLRVAAPLFLVSMLITSACLESLFYRTLLLVQLAFYAAATAGLVMPQRLGRITSIPAGFLFLNISVAQGLWDYLRGTYARGWKGGEQRIG